jgi:hypothetical protein
MWFGELLQNPVAKLETSPVLLAEQGAGKGDAFAEVYVELLRGYSVITARMESLVGTFNTVCENKKLVVCDELSSVDASKLLNLEPLKRLQTGTSMSVNDKNIRERNNVDNYANFIFISNNKDAIRIDNSDRRYVFCDVSNKYCPKLNNRKNPLSKPYFDALFAEIKTPGFYDQLLTHYMNLDVSKFDARDIPDTQTKQDVIEFSKSPYQLFIEQHIEQFTTGYLCNDAFDEFVIFCDRCKFKQCSIKTFGLKIKEFCDVKQKQQNRVRARFYVIRPDKMEVFQDADTDVADATATDAI